MMIRYLIPALSVLVSLSASGVAAESPLVRPPGDPEIAWGPCPPPFAAGCEIGVLHGDPAHPNADVFFRVPGGYELPEHWHTSAERMVLVGGRLQVQYAGHAASLLTPGSYAYGPPRLRHSGRCVSEEACVLFIAFEGPVDAHP